MASPSPSSAPDTVPVTGDLATTSPTGPSPSPVPAATRSAAGAIATGAAMAPSSAVPSSPDLSVPAGVAKPVGSDGESEAVDEEIDTGEEASGAPSRGWQPSIIGEVELEIMAKEGIIPPSDKNMWRSAQGDPSPTPISGDRVLLTSHHSRHITAAFRLFPRAA